MNPENSDAQLELARLNDVEDAAALVVLGFDFFMAQPLHRFVTPDQILAHFDEALRPAHVERVVTAHVSAALGRDQDRAQSRKDRLEHYFTPEALELAQRLAAAPVKLDPEFLEGLVKQDAVRHLVGVMVEETLGRFIQMLKPSATNGALGKGLFARIGAQMETQASKAAAGFVSTSLDFILGRLAHVLATPETERQLGRLRAEGFKVAMKLSTGDLWKLAEGVDLDQVLSVVPGLVTHNLNRPEIRELILAEATAALALEGDRTLAEILAPEAVEAWRQRCVERVTPLLGELAHSAPFQLWLAGGTTS